MIKRKGNVYKLDTPATTLLIRAERCAEYLYYGRRLSVPGSDYDFLSCVGEGNAPALSLVSSFGGGDARRFSVSCAFADGSFSPRFSFLRAKLTDKPSLMPLPSSYSDSTEKNACQTLALEFSDEPSRLRLFLYYTVFDDSDVIAVSARLFNGGKKEVRVKNLASLQLDVYGGGYSFVAFREGREGEYEKVYTPVTDGVVVRESRLGASSLFANPFVMLEKEGSVYAFNLVYSGGYQETAETDGYPRTRVLVGVNDFMLDKALLPGESFSSPEAAMTFAGDEEGVSLAMHDFVAKHIVRGRWKGRERPVVFAAGENPPDFTGSQAFAEAKKEAELGAEVFVLGGEASFPAEHFEGGEKRTEAGVFAAAAREAGIKFGIRVNLESISENSELYEKHPEYAMKIPGREPLRVKGRLLLNFADPRVQKYAVRALSSLLSETKASYVCWETGGRMADCFCRDVPAGEYFLRYTEGLYAVLGRIAEKFPGVLFEGGAGGGRFDLGLLCYFPQIAVEGGDAPRDLFLRSGVSCGYPPSVLSSRVRFDCASLSLPTGFYAAAFGAPTVEADFSALSQAREEGIRKRIAFFKKYRRLLQYGKTYRLGNAFSKERFEAYGLLAVSENKAAALALGAAETGRGNGTPSVCLKGLAEGAAYTVSAFEPNGGKREILTASGEFLTSGRIPLQIFCDGSLSGGALFAWLIVEKVKKNKGA